MRNIKTILLLVVMLLPAFAMAQYRPETGVTVAKYNVVADSYNFWLHTPEDYTPEHKFPLVIFLHGRSLCGRDLNMVKRYGVIDAISKGKYVPAVVMAPQNPGGSWNPRKINDIINWIDDNYSIDTTRIYVLGMSLGGYGTMDFVCAYPQRVAAAMALCGGCSRKSNLDGMGDVPMWIMHGTADEKVSIAESKRVVAYLQDIGKTDLLRYDWIAGGSHGILARLFYLQQTYDWLFSHCTAQRPRRVDRTFDITRSDMDHAYDELRLRNEMFEDD